MKKTNLWLRSQNPFLRFAEKNIKNFYVFSKECIAMLESNNSTSDIQQLYNDSLPVFQNFNQLYSTKDNTKAKRASNTMTQVEKFKELIKVKIPVWEAIVIQTFGNKSAEYLHIFPSGRSGFNKGSYDSRIHNLNALLEALSEYPGLSNLYNEVKIYRDDIEFIRTNKIVKQGNVVSINDELKNAANQMAVRLFSNLGFLMNIYANEPAKIKNYFPVRYMQNSKKPIAETNKMYKLNLAGNTVIEAGINFSNKDTLLITNNSNTELKVWFANAKDEKIPANAIEIPEDDEAEIVVKNYAGIDDRFLMIANTSMSEKALIEIMLIDNAA